MPLTANPYFSLLRTAWQHAAGERRTYLWVYARFVAANVIISLEPVIWGLYINEMQTGSALLRATALYAGVYASLKLVNWSIHGLARIEERELAFRIGQDFLETLYRETLALSPSWHQAHHSGDTLNRIRKAYEALKQFFQRGWEYLHTLSKFVFSFGAMLYFAPLFGVVALCLGVVIVLVILRFDKPYIRTLMAVNEGEHRLSARLVDTLSNILTVTILRLSERMQGALRRSITAIYPDYQANIRINEWKWFTVDMLVALIYGIILLGYVYQHYVPGEVFLIGGLVTLMGFVQQFTQVFQSVAAQYTQVVNYHTDVSTARRISEAYANLQAHLDVSDLPDEWKELRVSGLRFLHQTADNSTRRAGLHDIELRIRRGERIALIGASGSGKSTLLALLRHLYEPTEVQLHIDGRDYGDDLRVLSPWITLFPQEPEIFDGTVAENITLGLPISETEIQRLCHVACFDEVLHRLPDGLDTVVRERGANLSGGQRQRLALARGLFAARDSQLILLDEPTSSLDPATERRAYERLFAALEGRSVVSTLHRLHLLSLFDYIYVLEDGRIRSQGTLDELLHTDAGFQSAWRAQQQPADIHSSK